MRHELIATIIAFFGGMLVGYYVGSRSSKSEGVISHFSPGRPIPVVIHADADHGGSGGPMQFGKVLVGGAGGGRPAGRLE